MEIDKEKIIDLEDIDNEYVDEITCPWCGDKFSDSWECGDYEEKEQCEECGGLFSYQRNVEVSYCTTRQKCEKCDMKLKDHRPSYIYDNKNWTIYTCSFCEEDVIKTGKVAKDGEPYIIPLIEPVKIIEKKVEDGNR